MSRPLVIVRPEPGCGETVAAAIALGLPTIAAPLFAIEALEWDAPAPDGLDGLLAGSANVFRHGGKGLDALRAIPVHAVGGRTAEAAREAGFAIAQVGEGGLQRVVDTLQPPFRYLRLAGEARVDLAAPAGVEVVERVVYRAAPLPLTRPAIDALSQGAVVALHSGEAARRFAAEIDVYGLERARIAISALAPRIAESVGEGWQAVTVACEIADSALLALAAELCQ
jgi:uroporphyrinogen-III synthase